MFRRHGLGMAAAVALLAGGLAACGDADESDAAGATKGEAPTIETAKGEVEVPESPERVVVLDTGELDNALALGVKPVGAVTTAVDSGYLSYLDGRTEEIKNVGTISEPNLEKIAALNPDLILSSVTRHDKLYDQLSEIAPTVLSETIGRTWKQNLQLHAEALGKEDKAEQLMAEYDRKAEQVGKSLKDGTVISLVRFLPGETRLYSDKSFAGTIIEDVGAKVPEAARGEDTFLELSQEKLGVAEADYILTSTYGPSDDTEQAAITDSGLWTGLDAVKQGRTTEINDDLISGIGILAANGMLDELAKAFQN